MGEKETTKPLALRYSVASWYDGSTQQQAIALLGAIQTDIDDCSHLGGAVLLRSPLPYFRPALMAGLAYTYKASRLDVYAYGMLGTTDIGASGTRFGGNVFLGMTVPVADWLALNPEGVFSFGANKRDIAQSVGMSLRVTPFSNERFRLSLFAGLYGLAQYQPRSVTAGGLAGVKCEF